MIYKPDGTHTHARARNKYTQRVTYRASQHSGFLHDKVPYKSTHLLTRTMTM